MAAICNEPLSLMDQNWLDRSVADPISQPPSVALVVCVQSAGKPAPSKSSSKMTWDWVREKMNEEKTSSSVNFIMVGVNEW